MVTLMGADKTVDREAIRLATKLLLKAESTDSDHESVALALRSYSLLAGTINAFEELDASAAHRRERRLLQDRRAGARSPGRAGDPRAGASLGEQGAPQVAPRVALGIAGAPATPPECPRSAAAYRRFADVRQDPPRVDCAL